MYSLMGMFHASVTSTGSADVRLRYAHIHSKAYMCLPMMPARPATP